MIINTILIMAFYILVFGLALANNESKVAVLTKIVFFNNFFYCSFNLLRIKILRRKIIFFKFDNFFYITLLTIFYILLKPILENLQINNSNLINKTPYLFLFTGLINGFNLNLFIIYLVFLGINKTITNQKYRKYFTYYCIVSIFWSTNARQTNYYFFENYSGLTNTFYNFNSNFVWSLKYFMFFLGLYSFLKTNSKNFSYEKFIFSNFIAISFSLIIRAISNSNKIFEFIIQFYFGSNSRYGSPDSSINWFHFEFLLFLLFLIFIKVMKTKKINFFEFIIFFKFLFIFIIDFQNIIKFINSLPKFINNYVSRHDPTFFEILFGSGPYSYSFLFEKENMILDEILYYPASSIYSIFLFFGIFGVIIISISLINQNVKFKKNYISLAISSMLIIFLCFFDSINYVPYFINYFLIFIVSSKNKKMFNS